MPERESVFPAFKDFAIYCGGFSMFIMRQLKEDDLEQFNALLRYAFQVTTDELIKTGWEEDEIKYAKAPILRGAHVLGWFHKEHLASMIVIYPMEVNIFGNIYKMGGITGVATYPEYAGRGLIHSLMQKCLAYMKGQGQTVSFLYPYSIPFYRKKGWEIVSDKLTFRIKDTQLPKHHAVSGMVERVNLEHEDLKNVYEYFAKQHHGALIRDALAWDEYWRWDTEDMIAAIYYSEEHRPLGYIVYYIENEIFNIKEMTYLNQEARHGLWNYISAHFSMVDVVRGANYTGEPLAFLLEDSEITETIEPYIMARIVDVEKFLQDFPYPVCLEDMRIHFKVTDTMASWNNGTFVLYWLEEKTVCERVEDDQSINVVELDIQTLTTMFMGYKRPSYLYHNERIKTEHYLVQFLERLIPMEKPYFSDYF